MVKRLRLVCNQQIGDCLKVTTVAALFHEQYPEYELEIGVSHPDVFKHTPYIVDSLAQPCVRNAADGDEAKNIVCRQDDGDGLVNNPKTIHRLQENEATFTEAMVGFINAKYGFNLQVTANEPVLFLSQEEEEPFEELPGTYWVVNCGGEARNTRKIYPQQYWERLFELRPDVTFVQTGVSKDIHPTFSHPNVISRIDKDDIRSTFRLIRHAVGVITPISFTMHTAAAFRKPCIALAGGGEDVSWENYPYEGFNYLHTIGSFRCCQAGGCWKAHCDNMNDDGMQKCMALIVPELVSDLVSRYAPSKERTTDTVKDGVPVR